MRTPNYYGPGGRSWDVLVAMQQALPKNPDDATLAAWLTHAPGSHPFWPWHLLLLIHLRPIPGQSKEPYKKYPEAEYELLVLAIDPEKCPSPDPDHPPFPWLTPPDVSEQFDVLGSDHDARRIVESFARGIAEGRISPDQDWRRVWKECLRSTADHFKSGAHVES
jgi:hypothetical protein